MSAPDDSSPIVTEVVCFEDLPLGSRSTRRAIALERRQRERGADVVRRRDPDLRRRPHRKDPRAAALAALPSRPRLAAVLIAARLRHRCALGEKRGHRRTRLYSYISSNATAAPTSQSFESPSGVGSRVRRQQTLRAISGSHGVG